MLYLLYEIRYSLPNLLQDRPNIIFIGLYSQYINKTNINYKKSNKGLIVFGDK
jgi:hypothetical protein